MQVSLKAQVAFSGYLDTFRGPYDNKDFRFSDNLLCVTNFIAPSKAQAKSDQSKHLTEFIFRMKCKETLLNRRVVKQVSSHTLQKCVRKTFDICGTLHVSGTCNKGLKIPFPKIPF